MSTVGKTAKRAIFVLAVWVLLSMAVIVLMDRVVLPWLVHRARHIQVPNVVEMSLAEADSALVEAGLTMKEEGGEYDPFVPAGLILSQIPEAGSMVRGKGRWVRVVVSKGGRKVTVPNLQGVSLRQARLVLNRCGLELGQISWMYTEDLPENVVISSAPGYKAEVLQGEVIDLLVSQGDIPSTAIVPDFVGQSLEGAILLARDSGLRIGKITYRQDDNLLPETVLEQSVEVGQEVDREMVIDLLVSTLE